MNPEQKLSLLREILNLSESRARIKARAKWEREQMDRIRKEMPR